MQAEFDEYIKSYGETLVGFQYVGEDRYFAFVEGREIPFATVDVVTGDCHG